VNACCSAAPYPKYGARIEVAGIGYGAAPDVVS
jgi:hypothetical protein